MPFTVSSPLALVMNRVRVAIGGGIVTTPCDYVHPLVLVTIGYRLYGYCKFTSGKRTPKSVGAARRWSAVIIEIFTRSVITVTSNANARVILI